MFPKCNLQSLSVLHSISLQCSSQTIGNSHQRAGFSVLCQVQKQRYKSGVPVPERISAYTNERKRKGWRMQTVYNCKIGNSTMKTLSANCCKISYCEQINSCTNCVPHGRPAYCALFFSSFSYFFYHSTSSMK